MVRHMLLTLRSAAHVRTFSYDMDSASMLWIGSDAPSGAIGSWARLVERDGEALLEPVGDVVLCPASPVGVVGRENGCLALDGRAAMVSLRDSLTGDAASLYVRMADEGMARFHTFLVSTGRVLSIGRGSDNDVRYANQFVSLHHAQLGYAQGGWVVRDLQSGNGTLVNGSEIPALQPWRLNPGDVVQVLDLTMAVGSGFVSMNQPSGLKMRDPLASYEPAKTGDAGAVDTDDELSYFYPAPHLSRSSAAVRLEVDAPPEREEEEPQPVLMQIGPSFLMGMSSVFMGANAISGLMSGGSVLTALPSLSMTVALLGGTVIWPMVSRAYEQRMRMANEARVDRKYAAYIDGVENRLLDAAKTQTLVMNQNRLPVHELIRWTREESPQLMSHGLTHADFMELRVGIGDAQLDAEVSWPQRNFSTLDDMLWERVETLAENPPLMRDVPLACNLIEQQMVGIVGSRDVAWEFVRGMLVQVCARYSYHDVKIVAFVDERESEEWQFLTSLAHLYDDAGTQRLMALTPEGVARIDRVLDAQAERASALPAAGTGATSRHLVVLCACGALAQRSGALDRLRHAVMPRGFSLVYVAERLSELPRECCYLIDLDMRVAAEWGIAQEKHGQNGKQRRSCMFARSDVESTLLWFDPDILVTCDEAQEFALRLSRLHLGSVGEMRSKPESVGFLELFGVGNVGHLNIGQRWAESDPARTLGAPVGIDDQGQQLQLDIHEKAHGPHGLVAGTTGSGKSEFIICYILSVCVGFRPDEVSFVLIDYKGGGLAGAFENETVRLPHLAGTITNLDGSEVRRALVSVRSELKRRQRLFSEARELSGEATMDIHRYITLCRQGIVKTRLPHLVIVADEFAELKEQEPEFMDELISAARIGRSLGIHLILATQKPSGVVNDQIWANSRFKVALKVSDAADSREMIRREDAALLARPGEFYLLVGYDELYVGGQAAYAGTPYEPKEEFEPRRDTSVELLDAEGEPIARLRPQHVGASVETDELHAVLDQIVLTARTQGIEAGRLWLDPLPARMTLEQVCDGLGTEWAEGLSCVVGTLDDPERQEQRPLVLDLAHEGNVLLFGASDTGVDELLRTMLVSMLEAYGPGELWVYGWDGTAGILPALEGFPQVGGIVAGGDEERLENLVRMLEEELYRRKSEAAKQDAKAAPRIVCAIANLPAFLDTSDEMVDRLIALTRDGSRQGIHVMATAGNAHGVPLRLQTNFGESLLLWMRDEGDYATLAGGTVDVKPPHREKRGIVHVGKQMLEFLGVSLADSQERESAILSVCKSKQKAPDDLVARPIPVLPKHVTAQELEAPFGRDRFPIGYSKRRVTQVYVDLYETSSLLVCGNDRKALGAYLKGCVEVLQGSDASVEVLDMGNALGLAGLPSVHTESDAIRACIEELGAGDFSCDVLVVPNALQLLDRLAGETANTFTTYIKQGLGAGGPSLVLSAEGWQMASRFEDWARVLTSQGSGLWLGDGFADQTVLRYSRMLAEYRQPRASYEGYLVRGSKVESVRVLEPRGGDIR